MSERMVDPGMMYEPIVRLSEAYANGMISVGQEWNRFLANRFAHTNEALASLVQVGANPMRCMEVGNQFLMDAATDFNDTTRRVFSISGRIMQGAVSETVKPIETLRQSAKV